MEAVTGGECSFKVTVFEGETGGIGVDETPS
jgi:hypothetical protein